MEDAAVHDEEALASPAAELACNLPALVAQLKLLREEMEHKSKLYDALLHGVDAAPRQTSSEVPGPPKPSLDMSQTGMRGSIFTPFANSQLDSRASQMWGDDLSALDDERYANTLVSRQSSIMMRQQQQQRQPRRPQHRPTYSMPHLPVFRDLGDYTVMWVSGECGISLRNFSRRDNKVGAQIAVLQHADGVTTGISNCRLGDQLISINDEKVDSLRFREIVEKLKTTRRPISLGFRANPSVQTSPRAAASPGGFSNTTGGSRSSNFFRGGSYKSKLRKNKDAANTPERHSVSGGSHPKPNGFFDDESEDIVHETIDHPGYDHFAGHGTSNSGDYSAEQPFMRSSATRSSTSTLSDEVEMWCREQEEMHSDIIVLLTETVMRCEKLQQENLDQLQNLMQLSPISPRPSESSSATSSYVGTDKAGKESSQSDALEVDTLSPAVSSVSPTSPTA